MKTLKRHDDGKKYEMLKKKYFNAFVFSSLANAFEHKHFASERKILAATQNICERTFSFLGELTLNTQLILEYFFVSSLKLESLFYGKEQQEQNFSLYVLQKKKVMQVWTNMKSFLGELFL